MNESINKLMLLHPVIRMDALTAYNKAVADTPVGIHPIITSTVRTFEEQAVLYAQGRTMPGQIVTFSKAGQSYHNYGLALDFALQIGGKIRWEVNENWMIVVNCFKQKGFQWGGDWSKNKDYPHLDKRLLYNWKDLLAMHDKKQFIPGGIYIDLA